MKTYNVRYEFFNRQLSPPQWDIGRAVVMAESHYDSYRKLEKAYYELDPNDQTLSVLSSEELTEEVVWAY